MLENPLTVVGRLPPTVRLLIWGTLVNKLGTFIIPYLTLVLSREFGLGPAGTGALVTAYGTGSLVSILVGGYLTDALGRRRTLIASLFGSGALAVAMGLAPSVRVFVPLLLLFGFLADLYRPASSAVIGDLLASGERATGFAALRVAVNLGFAFGAGVGGLLVDWSWRALFLADGLTTVAFGAVVYAGIPETRPRHQGPAASDPADGRVWRDAVYLQVLFTSLAVALVVFSFATVFPLTVTAAGGYPAYVYGLLLGANGVLIGLFEVSAVAALSRFRRLRVAAVGMLLLGAGFGLTGLSAHWSWLLATVVIWTAGEIVAAPQHLSFAADWAPPAARGRYLGLYSATWSLGLILNPVLFLPLHARLGEAAFWPILPALLLPAAWVVWRLDATADRPALLRGASRTAIAEQPTLPALAPET
jgi:MFS family permease